MKKSQFPEMDLNHFHYPQLGFLAKPLPLWQALQLSVQDQAKHADAICLRYCQSSEYLELQKAVLQGLHTGGFWDFTTPSDTNVGNLALLALLHPYTCWPHWHTRLCLAWKN